MEDLLLYHGSNFIITGLNPSYDNRGNDYGRGFYLTDSEPVAKEFACSDGKNGYVTSFSLNKKGLKILDLTKKPYNPLNHLALLLYFRPFPMHSQRDYLVKSFILQRFMPDIKGYDIILGFRTDDSNFSLMKHFFYGDISYEALKKALKKDKNNRQYVLKSQKAFSAVKTLRYFESDRTENYPKKFARDAALKASIEKLCKENEGNTINDIIIGNWRCDDERL